MDEPRRISSANKPPEAAAAPAATSPETAWLCLLSQECGDEFWTLDLATNELRVFDFNEVGAIEEHVIAGGPEEAIESGSVHPSSAEEYRRLFDGIASGRSRSSADVLLRHRLDLAYSWCTLSYRLEYAKDGAPVRAVGVRRELEDPQRTRLWHRAVPSCLQPHLIRVSIADLVSRRVDTLMLRPGERARLIREMPLDRARQSAAARFFTKGETQAYLDLTDPEALARRHEEGRHWSVGRFRIVEGGAVKPVRVAVNVREGALGSLVAFVYASLNDQRTG